MPLSDRQAQVAPARGEAWKGEEPTFLCEECSHWEHEESTDLCIISVLLILIVSLWRKKSPVHGTSVSGIPSGSDRGHRVAKLNLAVISHVLLVGFGTIIVIMSKLSLGFLINSKKNPDVSHDLNASKLSHFHLLPKLQSATCAGHHFTPETSVPPVVEETICRKQFIGPSPSRKVWESDPLKADALQRLEQPGFRLPKQNDYPWKTPTKKNWSQTWEIKHTHTHIHTYIHTYINYIHT